MDKKNNWCLLTLRSAVQWAGVVWVWITSGKARGLDGWLVRGDVLVKALSSSLKVKLWSFRRALNGLLLSLNEQDTAIKTLLLFLHSLFYKTNSVKQHYVSLSVLPQVSLFKVGDCSGKSSVNGKCPVINILCIKCLVYFCLLVYIHYQLNPNRRFLISPLIYHFMLSFQLALRYRWNNPTTRWSAVQKLKTSKFAKTWNEGEWWCGHVSVRRSYLHLGDKLQAGHLFVFNLRHQQNSCFLQVHISNVTIQWSLVAVAARWFIGS